jgi:hypothetical protein
MTNFLSLALGQTVECWFFSLFLRQQSKFSRSSPLFFVYQFNNQEKKFKNTLFLYVYIAARSRIQQEHYLMILCSTIQEDARTLIFFNIYGRN